jgi:hypothetical protein
MALYPVAAYPSSAPVRGAALAAEAPCAPPPISTHSSLAALGAACNLDEICARLARIEQRLGSGATAPMPRPLPTGPASAQ